MKRIILPFVAACLGVLAVAAFLYFRGKGAPGDSQGGPAKTAEKTESPPAGTEAPATPPKWIEIGKPEKKSGEPTAARPPAGTGAPAAPPKWLTAWKREHKGVKPSTARVDVSVGPKATVIGSGFATSRVQVTNRTGSNIKIVLTKRLSELTDLYLGQELIGAKDQACYMPFMYGDEYIGPGDPVTVLFKPGQSKTLLVHTYWPLSRIEGKGMAVLGQKYKVRPLLVFDLDGEKQYVLGGESTVEIVAAGPAKLTTETYTVTYTPIGQTAGSIKKTENGFHLYSDVGYAPSFYLVASKPGESLEQVARRDKGFAKKSFLGRARRVVGRESAGKYYLVYYYWGDVKKTKWMSVYSRHDDLVFRIDWHAKGDPKDPDDLRGKKVFKLYDHLTIKQVRK